jgi:alpha-methylacyl-CoA racemase
MGPLAGCRVVEMAGIGPAPFCGMILADLGAEVIRIDRTGKSGLGVDFPTRYDLLGLSKRSSAIDLQNPSGLGVARALIGRADMLIEGFRPGVMERLGLGPESFETENPALVYGRMTGWGQEGPLAPSAGHDINYIAITGALDAIGREGAPPTIPLNLVGDFGGGSLYLVIGLLAALTHARASGQGQVVDGAIVDGVNHLLTMQYAFSQMGAWGGGRGTNLIDGGAPFYDTYETADGRHVAIGPVEAKFFAILVDKMGLAGADLPAQNDRKAWPELRRRLAGAFRTRTQAEWCDLLEGSDACFAPVLTLAEAREHPHNCARGAIVDVAGVAQPAPAPRFLGTPAGLPRAPVAPGADTDAILRDWRIAESDRDACRAAGAFG